MNLKENWISRPTRANIIDLTTILLSPKILLVLECFLIWSPKIPAAVPDMDALAAHKFLSISLFSLYFLLSIFQPKSKLASHFRGFVILRESNILLASHLKALKIYYREVEPKLASCDMPYAKPKLAFSPLIVVCRSYR